MFGRIIKIIILVGIIIGMMWFFDIDNFELKNSKKETSDKIKDQVEQVPILRNETVNQFFDRNFEGTLDEIIALANQSRQAEGLPALIRNETLVQSAMAKAQDMKTEGYFEHISPEGLQPWFFAEQLNYKYKTFGENLAEGFFSAEEVHEAWMNSEGHRKNLMAADFAEIGVAILDFEQNDLKSYLIVQHFGTQLTKSDLEPSVICKKKDKKNCEDAEDKKDDIKDAIEEQEDIIKEAKKNNADKKIIHKLEENLEDLEDMKDDIKDYLKQCEKFISKCDKWE